MSTSPPSSPLRRLLRRTISMTIAIAASTNATPRIPMALFEDDPQVHDMAGLLDVALDLGAGVIGRSQRGQFLRVELAFVAIVEDLAGLEAPPLRERGGVRLAQVGK